jgi:hypothetical protein
MAAQNSFTIDIKISSDTENAKAVTDTLLLAFDDGDNMLPTLTEWQKCSPRYALL